MALAGLNRQALDLDRRILALQTRDAGELVTAGAKASEELAESTAALAKSEKRAKNLEKQLARAEQGRNQGGRRQSACDHWPHGPVQHLRAVSLRAGKRAGPVVVRQVTPSGRLSEYRSAAAIDLGIC